MLRNDEPEIIGYYPEHRGSVVVLVWGMMELPIGREIGHVVCSEPRPDVYIITTYWPDPTEFMAPEFKQRVTVQ